MILQAPPKQTGTLIARSTNETVKRLTLFNALLLWPSLVLPHFFWHEYTLRMVYGKCDNGRNNPSILNHSSWYSWQVAFYFFFKEIGSKNLRRRFFEILHGMPMESVRPPDHRVMSPVLYRWATLAQWEYYSFSKRQLLSETLWQKRITRGCW